MLRNGIPTVWKGKRVFSVGSVVKGCVCPKTNVALPRVSLPLNGALGIVLNYGVFVPPANVVTLIFFVLSKGLVDEGSNQTTKGGVFFF